MKNIFRVIFFVTLLFGFQFAKAQSPKSIKTEEEVVRENMLSISRQLGVTCNVCHSSENFKSDKKVQFKIAKEHIRITQLLIDSGMDGKKGPKASCFMCHRGELNPPFKTPDFQIK